MDLHQREAIPQSFFGRRSGCDRPRARRRRIAVPAFWSGAQTWRVRYSPATVGTHTWRSVSTDTGNTSLHGQQGTIAAHPYTGANPLYRHGPLKVAKDHRHFEQADGTPFFWLADTWWMGLVKRLKWPEDFALLAADRQRKGFTVVQIVAGLYPDMPERDPRGANEAGFPYDASYTEINPAYFDRADQRIRHLVESNLAPCIVGCWGYYLPILGVEKMKRHWRYLGSPLGRLSGGVVSGRRRSHAVLSFEAARSGFRHAEGRLDGAREICSLHQR